MEIEIYDKYWSKKDQDDAQLAVSRLIAKRGFAGIVVRVERRFNPERQVVEVTETIGIPVDITHIEVKEELSAR